MYKMIIADDEPLIRAGLKNLIEWEVYGIEIVGEAEDGMKAYLTIKSLVPDLALIDISMPNMNGIELIELASKLEHPPKFIILSGYNDFTYVQKAMQLGAVNYLLKPVDSEELVQTVISTVQLLDDMNSHNKQMQESLHVLRNNILQRVLHNRIESRELREKCQVVNLSFHCSHMYAAALCPYMEHVASPVVITSEMISCCQEICDSVCSCYLTPDQDDTMIAIIFKDKSMSLDELTIEHALEECAAKLLQVTGLTFYFSLGHIAQRITELSASYQGALTALEKNMLFGDVFSDDVSHDISFPQFNENQFLELFEEKNTEGIRELLHCYFAELLTICKNQDITLVKYHLIGLVTSALQSLHALAIADSELTYYKNTSFELIRECDSLTLLEKNLNLFFLSMLENTISTSTTGCSHMIQNVLSYVQNNYNDCDLSLKTLAAKFEVNAAYLGRQFSMETQEYFSDYLNRIRIAKAIHLLTQTTWKTSKIAEAVGFINISYFFTIFKKCTGKKPGDYRKELG